MDKLFRVDGKLYAFLGKFVDLTWVVLLWLVGCLPVVTILTSTASLYTTVVKCIRYEQGRVFHDFWDAYRKNLRQGIGLTLFYGCVGAVISFLDYQIFFASTNRSGLFLILAVLLLGMSIVYLLNLLWIAPVFSRFSNTFGNMLKLNYVIALRNLPRSIPMLLVIIVSVVLVLAMNTLIFLLPSVVWLVNSFLTEPALRKFMPEEKENNGDWRYGFR